jgi:hypothetical protein
MVALILDAWTSSNGHAFLAIVARFVNKDFELGSHNLHAYSNAVLIRFQKKF